MGAAVNPLTIIVFALQGSTVKVLVNFFQIKLDEEEEKTLAEEIVGSTFDHIAEGVEEIVGYGGLNRLKVRNRDAECFGNPMIQR